MDKEKKQKIEAEKRAGYSVLEKQNPMTWAARMPAYCYTVLCPVLELREAPKRGERRREGRSGGKY